MNQWDIPATIFTIISFSAEEMYGEQALGILPLGNPGEDQ